VETAKAVRKADPDLAEEVKSGNTKLAVRRGLLATIPADGLDQDRYLMKDAARSLRPNAAHLCSRLSTGAAPDLGHLASSYFATKEASMQSVSAFFRPNRMKGGAVA
jgi:hypothetical protein